VQPPITRIGPELAGRHAAQFSDTITDGHGGDWGLGIGGWRLDGQLRVED
jgi:hypothetical protein